MTTELERLDQLEGELQRAFDSAVAARDHAQLALQQVGAIKQGLTKRRIEILRQQQATKE